MSGAPIVAIVEDDEAVREALSDLLLVLGYLPRGFDRAEALLAAFADGQFDCVITDIVMPGVDGLELQRRLRALGSSAPLIVVTSTDDPAIKARAIADGAHAVLAKPVSEDVLIRSLETALSGKPRRDGESGKDPDA